MRIEIKRLSLRSRIGCTNVVAIGNGEGRLHIYGIGAIDDAFLASFT